MEPIVLLGLIVVVYAGYVALADLVTDISVLFPQLKGRVFKGDSSRSVRHKVGVKKMARMHI